MNDTQKEFIRNKTRELIDERNKMYNALRLEEKIVESIKQKIKVLEQDIKELSKVN